MVVTSLPVAALLFTIASFAAAHGKDHSPVTPMDAMANSTLPMYLPDGSMEPYYMPSYAGLDSYFGWMLAHIVLEVVAWFFVLPIGIMFSITRSPLALPTQLLFLVLNGLGVVFGTIYNVNTPDLYENNAHHRIGWIATWIMTAQAVMSLLFLYSGRSKKIQASSHERAAFLPVSLEAMTDRNNAPPYSDYRWSGDSGQGTERSSYHNSRDTSPTDMSRYAKPEAEPEDEDDDGSDHAPRLRGFLRNTFMDKYLAQRIPSILSHRLRKALEAVYEGIDRTVLVLGFIALLTGGVTYGGLFRAHNIFSGLAHFIKGGIFFWYGLLTLGRWMGCFAEFGWAWNVKPTRSEVGSWKASIPSAEFTESFVIFLYGSTNVFLEHLGGWGGAWSPQDLEHVSISIMFFGGGLCGMLIESTRVRHLLNMTIEVLPARIDVHPAEAQATRAEPKTYHHSMNPMPGLIILLLGIMMSSHHQTSMVSTMVHKQWGTLFIGFALARAVTYILFFISPPTSVFASRPPSELVSAFCLIAGGLIFMASAKDPVYYMEKNDLNAMFVFTVCMGFTAFLMAWTIIVLAVQGWCKKKQIRTALRH